MSPHSSFDMLPEELTEHILSLCVTASFEPPPPRPIWLAPVNSRPQSVSRQDRRCSAIRTRLAPLLVSKTFHRISTPHYYSTVRITSPEQAVAFLRALQTHHIAPHVRRFLSSSILPTLGAVLQHCKNINYIDICLDSGSSPSTGVDSVTEEFCNALDALECVRHISLRKASNTYLTLPRVRYILTRLAVTVEKWTCLETANVAFRMSDESPQTLLAMAYPAMLQSFSPSTPTLTPSNVSPPESMSHLPVSLAINSPICGGPISLLTSALAKSPSLHTFITHAPSLWNESILCVSQNSSLQKIILGDHRTGVSISGLFMNEAKRHPRLTELIKAGTPMIRMRAQTLGNFGNAAGTASPSLSTKSPGCGKADSDHVPVTSRSASMMVSSPSSAN